LLILKFLWLVHEVVNVLLLVLLVMLMISLRLDPPTAGKDNAATALHATNRNNVNNNTLNNN